MNRQNKLPRLFLTILGGVMAVLGLLGTTLVDVVFKDALIIQTHYSTWRIMSRFSHALLGIGQLFLVIGILRLVMGVRDKPMPRPQELHSPQGVRAYLQEQLLSESISEQALDHMRSMLDQLDAMQEYRQRLERLEELNDLSPLGPVAEILAQMEESLCTDCRITINDYIVGGTEEFVVVSNRIEANNERILKKAKQLLQVLADYANGLTSETDTLRFLQTCQAHSLDNSIDYTIAHDRAVFAAREAAQAERMHTERGGADSAK